MTANMKFFRTTAKVLIPATLLFAVSGIAIELDLFSPETHEATEGDAGTLATASTAELGGQYSSNAAIPKTFMADIPFITQAPLYDWSWPFNHACEETSILMAHKYLTKEKISPERSQKEILEIVDFETSTYGKTSLESAAAQIGRLIEDYYGYETEVRYDITLDDIKREMVAGNLVLVPTAGQRLENPHFKAPGPVYHMIVMKGFNEGTFIVNEPGTRHGADFIYTNEILERAIRDVIMDDWDTPRYVSDRTAMIIIKP
jgi:hypothetical protein